MINIEDICKYYDRDEVYITQHAAERCRQRGIKSKDIRHVICNGEIIEQYQDDYPYPSCLILGRDENNQVLHVCLSDEGTASRIITAYYPDINKWSDDFKKRRESQ